jgi:hypothetical protein
MYLTRTFALAAALTMGIASAGFAATGRDGAGNPNGATNGMSTAPDQHKAQSAPHGNGQVPPGGTTVGPASGNTSDSRGGYAKGGGENSPVGKQ